MSEALGNIIGGQSPPPSSPDTPTAGAGTVVTPTAAPSVATTRQPMSPLIKWGVPLLAGVASAASPAAARGVQGATHMLSALDKDPYGYKGIAAQQKEAALHEALINKQGAQVVRENPEKYGLSADVAKVLPDKRLMEIVGGDLKPTYHSVQGVGLVRTGGGGPQIVMKSQPRISEVSGKELLQGAALAGMKTIRTLDDVDKMTPEERQTALGAYYQKQTDLMTATKYQPAINLNIPLPGTRGGGRAGEGPPDMDWFRDQIKNNPNIPQEQKDAVTNMSDKELSKVATQYVSQGIVKEPAAEVKAGGTAAKDRAWEKYQKTPEYGMAIISEDAAKITELKNKFESDWNEKHPGSAKKAAAAQMIPTIEPSQAAPKVRIPKGAVDTGKTSGGKKVYQLRNGNYWTE